LIALPLFLDIIISPFGNEVSYMLPGKICGDVIQSGGEKWKMKKDSLCQAFLDQFESQRKIRRKGRERNAFNTA